MRRGVAVPGPSDRAGAATFHLQPPARNLEWLCGHRVRRGGNAAALSGQFVRFEVAMGLLNTQEVRFEPKTAHLTTQEVRFDGKRNFKPPKRQSRGSGMMKRSRKMKVEVVDDLADRLADQERPWYLFRCILTRSGLRLRRVRGRRPRSCSSSSMRRLSAVVTTTPFPVLKVNLKRAGCHEAQSPFTDTPGKPWPGSTEML